MSHLIRFFIHLLAERKTDRTYIHRDRGGWGVGGGLAFQISYSGRDPAIATLEGHCYVCMTLHSCQRRRDRGMGRRDGGGEMVKLRRRVSQGEKEREGKWAREPCPCCTKSLIVRLTLSSLPASISSSLTYSLHTPSSSSPPAFLNLFFLFILKRGHFWCVCDAEWRKPQLVLLLSTVPVGQSPVSRGY